MAARKKRNRGGQLGHKGKRREFLQPDEIKHLVPESCSKCDAAFSEQDAKPVRHQQIDVPPVKPVVTDYFCHSLKCRTCGHKQRTALPATLSTEAFGPNICAVAGLLSGRYRLRKRLICEMMQDLFGVGMALGTVSNIERRLSAALATPVGEAAAFIREQNVIHADETGWTENKRKAWMWVVACASVAVFTVDTSRGSDVAKRLMRESENLILVSDR